MYYHLCRTHLMWLQQLLIAVSLYPLPAFSMPDTPPMFFGIIGKYGPADFYVTDVATDDAGNVYLADLHHETVSKYAPDGSLLLEIADPEFHWPRTITVDKSGNIYVLDNTRGTIRVYSNTGQLIDVWEGLFCAGEVHADIFGRLLVALNGNEGCGVTGDHIVVLDANGNELQHFGSTGILPGQFNRPYGICDSPDGSIYVADTGNNRVQKFDANGNYLSTVGGPGSDPGEFWAPRAPATDSNGNLFVRDRRNDRIQKFDSNGEFLLLWGERGTEPGQFLESDGIEIGPDDTLWVAGYHAHDVQHFDNNGNFIERWKGHESGPGEFAEIVGIGIGGNQLFAVDHWNQRIQVFDAASGAFLNAFGERNQGEGTVFNFPRALTVGPSGDLYISDDDNIRRIKPDGTFVALFPRPSGLRGGSFGLATSSDGVLFQADTGNHRINKVDTDTGAIIDQWGRLGSGPGQFDHPSGVAIGPDGTVYVADRENSRVQLFTQAGDYLQEWTFNENPRTLAIDPAREIIYIGKWARVVAYDLDGNFLYDWGSSGDLPGQFTGIIDIALSADGNTVYVSERNNSRIQRFIYPEVQLGTPSYIAGSDHGFYIWQDASDGEWHIRWSGDSNGPDLFSGTVTATEDLLSVQGHSIEGNDSITIGATSISFNAYAGAGEDGIDFFLPDGAEVTFNLFINQNAALGSIHLGESGATASTGTVTLISQAASTSIEDILENVTTIGRPDYVLSQDAGYFLWQDGDDGEWHLRWSGDSMGPILYEGTVSSSAPISNVRLYSFESTDELVTTSAELQFSGLAGAGDDGIDFFVPEGAQVSFSLLADNQLTTSGIFIGQNQTSPSQQPFTLLSAVTSISAFGLPSYVPAQDAGYYLWQDNDDGEWHLRWSGDSTGPILYEGTILSSNGISAMSAFGFESNDQLAPTPSGLSFSGVAGAGDDGVDFSVPVSSQLIVEINVDGNKKPEMIYIGTDGISPITVPLSLFSP